MPSRSNAFGSRSMHVETNQLGFRIAPLTLHRRSSPQMRLMRIVRDTTRIRLRARSSSVHASVWQLSLSLSLSLSSLVISFNGASVFERRCSRIKAQVTRARTSAMKTAFYVKPEKCDAVGARQSRSAPAIPMREFSAGG